MIIGILTALAFLLGHTIAAVTIDLYEQKQENNFRQTVGLQKKAVRIRRIT